MISVFYGKENSDGTVEAICEELCPGQEYEHHFADESPCPVCKAYQRFGVSSKSYTCTRCGHAFNHNPH